jgi:hypothetical protein
MLESLHGIRSKELKAIKDKDLLRYNLNRLEINPGATNHALQIIWKNKDAQAWCMLIENIEGKLGQIESYLSTCSYTNHIIHKVD